MKDILIITSYFPPETGAASNRMFHLSKGLQEEGFSVSILTPLPNYPTGKIFEAYKGKFKLFSIEYDLKIYRLWIYASNSKNKLLRLFAMLSYSFSLIWFFMWHKIPKTVIVQSPPLLVAFTSMVFLRSKKRNLILNVSDLWPLAGYELGVFKKNLGYKLLERIELFNYKKADLILGQSEEILRHVKSHYSKKPTFLYRNYPDFKAPEIKVSNSSEGKIQLVYAGLLGVAQGIYKMCQMLDYSHIEFHIYGAGSEKESIETFIAQNPESPITYYGEVTREELHVALLRYDIALIPLLNRIYGSVPSKIFEYAKLGLPMLYFGGGEGENIVTKHKLGWIADVGNYTELNNVLSIIKKSDISSELKQNILKTAEIEFNFKKQLGNLKKMLQ